MVLGSRHLSLFRLPRRLMSRGTSDAESIFMAGLRAVQPAQLVSQNVRVEGNSLHIADSAFNLNRNVHLIGFGKASLGLVNHIGNLITDHVVAGVVSCPNLPAPEDGSLKDLVSISPSLASRISVFHGPTNNIPNETVVEASRAIFDLANGLQESDILLTVITGGGSALLTLPEPSLTLADIAATTRLLSNAGCDIVELNTVRKQLDVLKGGGLARLAQPAQVVSLILSDVIGDPLDVIAAGPTVENSTGPTDALIILQKHKLIDEVPGAVLAQLRRPLGERSPTGSATNLILGSNRVALEAASLAASSLGYTPLVLSHALSGRAETLAVDLADLAAAAVLDTEAPELASVVGRLCADAKRQAEAVEVLNRRPDKLCVLAGGEPTVLVPPNPGVGGRAVQTALAAARGLERLHHRSERLTLLVGATDGLDGPTKLAGAWVTPQTTSKAAKVGLDTGSYLHSCDAYGFFQKLQGGVNIRPGGLTGTNVMDLVVLTLER